MNPRGSRSSGTRCPSTGNRCGATAIAAPLRRPSVPVVAPSPAGPPSDVRRILFDTRRIGDRSPMTNSPPPQVGLPAIVRQARPQHYYPHGWTVTDYARPERHSDSPGSKPVSEASLAASRRPGGTNRTKWWQGLGHWSRTVGARPYRQRLIMGHLWPWCSAGSAKAASTDAVSVTTQRTPRSPSWSAAVAAGTATASSSGASNGLPGREQHSQAVSVPSGGQMNFARQPAVGPTDRMIGGFITCLGSL